MCENIPKYPIGIQSFPELRNGNYIYVDKTMFIQQLLLGKYYFLSRPRRFGKSLFLSTLEAYFKGRKELFEGLAIAEVEKEWVEYPVVRIDFNTTEGNDIESVKNSLRIMLMRCAASYAVEIPDYKSMAIADLFTSLILALEAKTGRKVVVLIDEYDKALIEVMHDPGKLGDATDTLRPFFSVLKTADEHIKFAFITGVSRFRNTTIFSGFNNPNDISMNGDFASVLGITQQEMEQYFQHGINAIAREYEMPYADMVQVLRDKYDGYRFTRRKEYVYNPFSVLNALYARQLDDAWVKSGTSRILKTYLQGSEFTFDQLTSKWMSANALAATYSKENPTSLFFQTGYLTIREFQDDFYKLGIPNQEVQAAIVDLVIPEFVKGTDEYALQDIETSLRMAIKRGDVDTMMELLRTMLASVPYHEIDTRVLEKHLHLCMYIVFMMLGISTKCEIAQSGGRVDMVARTPWRIYVFEFKLDCAPEDALRQIDDKGYAIPWSADGRKLIKVGVNFSSKTRTIDSWAYENENN